MRYRACCATSLFVVVGFVSAGDARARPATGFSTLLPMTLGPAAATSPGGHGMYVETPSVAAPHAGSAPRRTTLGRIAGYLHCALGCGGNDPGYLPARAVDPNTGASIGAFGAAYLNASPTAHGLASHEQATVGYGP